jgi:selenide,water dikinase
LVRDPNLIAGIEGFEDAGVYRLNSDLAIIQTVDFFTPIVDDPRTFGRIAAANALSDVYAMGRRPLTAMNIICFPVNTMDISILHDILLGGLEKMKEAEVTLVGGHSVDDPELKYGLSVTGVIHPDKVLRNKGARTGDKLILTKALGTGIVSTALKGEVVSEELLTLSVESMSTLNRKAAELLVEAGEVHACTDVTGFGFLGHAAEMIEGTDVGVRIFAMSVPVFPGLRELVEMGIVPGGLYRNKNFRMPMVEVDPGCPQWLFDVLFDPQTSGGLLIALPEPQASSLLGRMHAARIKEAALVGEVVSEPKGRIIVEK